MRVTISSTVLEQILAESQGMPDREVCGLLLGKDAAIRAAQRCRNVAEDPARRFEIDPAAWLSECDLTENFFARFGARVPPALMAELESLRYRLRH